MYTLKYIVSASSKNWTYVTSIWETGSNRWTILANSIVFILALSFPFNVFCFAVFLLLDRFTPFGLTPFYKGVKTKGQARKKSKFYFFPIPSLPKTGRTSEWKVKVRKNKKGKIKVYPNKTRVAISLILYI